VEKIIHFGTDGIRGKADKFPFTHKALICLGKSIAHWSSEKYGNNQKVFLANDTRISCENIKHFLKIGFADYNLKCIDGGVLPTPAVLQIITHDKSFDFGIVISASHNPYTDNGIKLFDGKSGKLNEIDEKEITNLFSTYFKDPSLENTNYIQQKKPTLNSILYSCPEQQKKYCQTIISKFQTNFLKGITVALDCANGATYDVAPQIFKSLGAEVTTISNKPNGKNINYNCGALHPQNLKNTILKIKADIGFAFDGDGDRVIAINNKGEIRDGDDILAELSNHPQLKEKNTVVGTIMTNHGFAKHLEQKGKKLLRTPVGDKHVSAKLEEEKLLLGGESSGHIIIKNYLNSGDGIFAALKMLESIKESGNWELNTFQKFPQILINVPISKKDDLSKKCYANIIESKKQELENGRIIVRFSGTENILRVMTEDQDRNLAQNAAECLAKELSQALDT
jgi:phosphoglucosamine mutase